MKGKQPSLISKKLMCLRMCSKKIKCLQLNPNSWSLHCHVVQFVIRMSITVRIVTVRTVSNACSNSWGRNYRFSNYQGARYAIIANYGVKLTNMGCL